MSEKIKFDAIPTDVPPRPGVYEIWLNSGIALKVGITKNLLNRLKKNRASRQSELKLKPGGDRSNPNDVKSKGSILAKHLYYDQSIGLHYDLRTEAGRRAFLRENCFITFAVIENDVDLKVQETSRESSGEFRYVGEVIIR